MSGWNFALAETGIVNRLTDKLQTGPDRWARLVGTRGDLEAVTEDMQTAPAVYVVYDGFFVVSADEFQAEMAHRWLVVIAVATAASQREAAPLNQAAGPFIRDVLEALHGYTPPDCKTALVPITPPRPFYGEAKFAYFPLAFKNDSFHCATPQF